MSKQSIIQRNKKRLELHSKLKGERVRLKSIINDQSLPMNDRFAAQCKLHSLPRDSSCVRIRNRCFITGRPRGYYRKFGLSRINLRELGLSGKIPGLVKSSW